MERKKYPPVKKALKQYYGYDSFRPGQASIIKALLDGEDVLAVMATGAGKSICYQLPAIFMPGITLVISPLISLMKDQVNALIQNKIPAAYLNSSLTLAQYRKALTLASQNKYKIIYVAPERLSTPGFQAFAQKVEISMIVVDEAHCISQWGQNFRPSYLEIAQFANQLEKRPVLAAFTATATQMVKNDILERLELHNPVQTTTGFDRPNLFFEIRKPKDKYSELVQYLNAHEGESGIIYCLTRKDTEEICDRLNEDGFHCTRYHAGLSDEERNRNQEDFIYDRYSLITATNAFGMGIDKSNVRFVVHYSMPSSLENYYQEAGRAGRDGEESECLLMFSPKDLRTNRFLIENSNDEDHEEQMIMELHRLKIMENYCKTSMCLRSFILDYFGEHSDGHCNKCSNCLSTWSEEDISEEAKTVYALMKELPRHYGISMIEGVLKGQNLAKIRQAGLDTLSNYGSLKKLSQKKIREILESLLFRGYLVRSADSYQTLSLSPAFHKAIKEQEPIVLQKKMEATPAQSIHTIANSKLIVQSSLLSKLKDLRWKLSLEQHVPPYIIFSDKVLHQMCDSLPATKEEMLSISGIGPAKLEKYGDAFLEVIQTWKAKTSSTND